MLDLLLLLLYLIFANIVFFLTSELISEWFLTLCFEVGCMWRWRWLETGFGCPGNRWRMKGAHTKDHKTCGSSWRTSALISSGLVLFFGQAAVLCLCVEVSLSCLDWRQCAATGGTPTSAPLFCSHRDGKSCLHAQRASPEGDHHPSSAGVATACRLRGFAG